MNAPRLTRSEALALQSLVNWVDERSAQNPWEYMRGYLAHAALEPAPDSRREPEVILGVTNGAPVARVPLTKRPP
jgi:hypothetical protein